MRALLLALALSACAGGRAPQELPAPQLPQRAGVDAIVAARAEGVEFRVFGDGVVIDIFRADRMRLSRSPGTEVITFPKPEAQHPRWSGEIYETESDGHTLRIEIHRSRACASGNRALYPTHVEIVLDGQAIAACGRAL
jgi:hypothetical protein